MDEKPYCALAKTLNSSIIQHRMNSKQPQLDYSRLQTPRENRTALIVPSFDQVTELVAQNRGIRDRLQYDLQGRSLADISVMARAELIALARRWTAAYRNIPSGSPDPNGLIYLAGHQPRMFHPGVWFKNFALGTLAQKHGATAVNLIVDNDVISDASLPVPGGSISEPNSMRIPFDLPEPKIPFEERRIEDRELFATFGRRVIEQLAPLVADPLIAEYWPLVLERARHGDNLGACLAQARHQLESHFLDGAESLEVPESWICTGEAFQWLTVHVLANLPRFREVYNEAVLEYRKEHRVRSRSHPVPELAEEGPWLESPLWIWTKEDPRRRRLFARTAGDEIVLSDLQSWEARLPIRMCSEKLPSPDQPSVGARRGAGGEGRATKCDEESFAESSALTLTLSQRERGPDCSRAVERLLELQRGDVCIRSRALMTTLWARLALGDLFIHGIGGAKYDQVTDRLIERFFGLRPPGFLVVSATMRLPIESPSEPPNLDRHVQKAVGQAFLPAMSRQECLPHLSKEDESRAIHHELRSMTYHPEKFLDGGGEYPAELVAEKRRWIETPQTLENARERCRAIRQINAGLQTWIGDRRGRLIERQIETARRLEFQGILKWREYAFCFFPAGELRAFMKNILQSGIN